MSGSSWYVAEVTPEIVFIVDYNDGGKSVTNDAENVYNEVRKDYPGRRVVYLDSNGDWDEIALTMTCAARFLPYNGETPDV